MATGSDLSLPRRSGPVARLLDWIVDWIADIGAVTINGITAIGEFAIFVGKTIAWLLFRLPLKETLLPNYYKECERSLPVVALTGTFIGMVLAVQSHSQFAKLGLETRLGAVINMSLVTELGPVLAGTMLAGRVGSSIAAELGTMRVTEQIDALASMGANPIHYLVVPRLLACLCLIPALTVVANFMGVVGGAFYSIFFFDVDAFHYWHNTQQFVGLYDLFTGIFKSLWFGCAIALLGCYRGFNCDPGAEGVGRAATAAFVYSFVVIIMLDLLLGILLNTVHDLVWPQAHNLAG